MKLPRWFHRFGSPPWVYGLAARLAPWLGATATLLLLTGTAWGLFIAPPDVVQGEVYRIIYIHPQSAYIGMLAYTLMAIAGGVGFIWRIKLAHAAAVAAAPVGTWFTFCALVTGAIWGRPTWGTYWEWGDPRLMFELLLLFLFLGYLALRAAFDDRDKADRVSAVLAMVGVVVVPLIHYAVDFWGGLHQSATITLGERPAMDTAMLIPFLIQIAGFSCLFYWLLLRRLQADIADRESGARWLKELIAEGKA